MPGACGKSRRRRSRRVSFLNSGQLPGFVTPWDLRVPRRRARALTGPDLRRPNVCLGRARIRRHRIWSSLVIDRLASGMSVQDVISEHGTEENDVLACIAYGAVTFGWKIHTMTRAEPAQRRRQSWISSHVSQSNSLLRPSSFTSGPRHMHAARSSSSTTSLN
ncbi:DUF433 domain-containing protein [Sorangium sp. So ce542]|uniref:DUF433 domain-containing protein n=1 Tax=Sorangium sp. So ce542 TaxID=3133316 RepID=UPI003F61FC62